MKITNIVKQIKKEVDKISLNIDAHVSNMEVFGEVYLNKDVVTCISKMLDKLNKLNNKLKKESKKCIIK